MVGIDKCWRSRVCFAGDSYRAKSSKRLPTHIFVLLHCLLPTAYSALPAAYCLLRPARCLLRSDYRSPDVLKAQITVSDGSRVCAPQPRLAVSPLTR